MEGTAPPVFSALPTIQRQSRSGGEIREKATPRQLHPYGHLNTDAYMVAIMSHRNTQDRESGKSPAEVVYGRNLTDAFRFMSELDKYSNERVQPVWREAWRLKELANRHHFNSQQEETNAHARQLLPLQVGAKVFVQNQHGNNNLGWDQTGMVIECLPFASYQ